MNTTCWRHLKVHDRFRYQNGTWGNVYEVMEIKGDQITIKSISPDCMTRGEIGPMGNSNKRRVLTRLGPNDDIGLLRKRGTRWTPP